MYSWPRDGLIPAIDAVLESLWLYPLFSFFLATGDSGPGVRYPLPWIVALMLVPAVVGRFIDRSYWGPRWLQQYGLTALLIGLFVAFMLAYHAVGVGWLAAAVLLGRGVWLALGDTSAQSAAGWFLTGFAVFLALLAVLIVAHVNGFEDDRAQLGPLLAAYLLIGLGWIALVRKQEMEEQAFRRPARHVDGAWVALLTAMSAIMVGAVALVSFSGTGVLMGILRFVAVVAGAIWQAGLYVAANWLGPALAWLFSRLRFGAAQTSSGPLFGRRPQPGRNLDAIILAWLQQHLPVPVLLALLLAMFAVMLSVWLAMRLRMWRTDAEDEERSSVWSWRLFWSQVRRMLRHFRPSFRASARSARPQAAALRPPASSIRRFYAAVLRWCRERDRTRAPAVTPLEFAPALSEETDAALAGELTAAYVRARYAEAEPPPEDIDHLQQQWSKFLQAHQAAPSPKPPR
jgi:hypothetical protein